MMESALGSILHTMFHSKCKKVGVKKAVWAFASFGVGTGQNNSWLSSQIRLESRQAEHQPNVRTPAKHVSLQRLLRADLQTNTLNQKLGQ
jgi:hypothetical protein